MNTILLMLAMVTADYKLPKGLLTAICEAESRLDPVAYAYRDGKGENNHSHGLCQVTYQTALWLGMKEYKKCTYNNKWLKRRTYYRCPLFDPYVNMTYAAKYLKFQLDRYDGNITKAISAYNAGSYIKYNKKYVERVFKLWQKYK